ncbi:hypothetical protein EC957_002382 [Mortierella hygrophila]|uniref:Uncharacterized protein n=1 Tax=Mortierella hygrophila TaxID=979708 RepID=A0A9P6F4V6_9FUNG|nr:hypothetical protein EC957_002382 [Mortierella hygrophila]
MAILSTINSLKPLCSQNYWKCPNLVQSFTPKSSEAGKLIAVLDSVSAQDDGDGIGPPFARLGEGVKNLST